MDLEDLEVVSTKSEDQYSFRTESDSQSGGITVEKEEDEIQFALPSFSNKNQENENIFETKTETLLQVLLPHAENLKHDNLKQKEEETCLLKITISMYIKENLRRVSASYIEGVSFVVPRCSRMTRSGQSIYL